MINKEELDKRDRAIADRVRVAASKGLSVADLLRLVQKEYDRQLVRVEAMVVFRIAFGLDLRDVRVIAEWSGWNQPGCTLDDDAIAAELRPKVDAALKAQK